MFHIVLSNNSVYHKKTCTKYCINALTTCNLRGLSIIAPAMFCSGGCRPLIAFALASTFQGRLQVVRVPAMKMCPSG